eukprot:CAMPEP_0176228396 /NCGR_PEP_ID=MMETSP0121_2-20121125/23255_1 /TAXON_ID=160619 /ORGANISM="Kryptoperidinium foliaceum, Strain CCMP 1326" /LENGTH=41 /DNA_ID= /DNA_START= /DNA_END= /DNA_ORIENTATION=
MKRACASIAFGAALLVGQATASDVSPIQKVVQMISDFQGKI